jgi:putative DNA primase/helicase
MTGLKVQKFAFFYGSGANGKSVLIDLIARMMGDYAHSAKIESFTGRNRRGGGDATPDIFPLMGARMVRASEPEEGERLQEGLIKELTGGEPLLVRQLHEDFIEVHPFFKLTISGNHKPEIRGTDDGIWRRVLLVPFDVQIPPEERDEKLIEKLWAERSGVLNWLIDGLLQYLEAGLQEPAQVRDATQDYRADSDPIGSFLGDACVVTGDPDNFLYARELIQGFNLWLDLRGEGMWGDRTISLKFKNLAGRFRDTRTGKQFSAAKRDATGYRGVRFTPEFRRQFDDAPRDAKGRPVAAATTRREETSKWDGEL